MRKVLLAAGARPNFMKIAPLMHALTPDTGLTPVLVHTGQHFSPEMSELFFRDLRIPEPDFHLHVHAGTHAQQTAQIMTGFEPIVQRVQPDWVLVVGDVNSTVACALVAKKLHVPLAHVEAGLRSFDRRMPEEINRLVTDAIADCLFTTEPSAEQNLLREGQPHARIHAVGNLMIDTLLACRERSRQSDVLTHFGIAAGSYGVLTLHRPENVDDPSALRSIWRALESIAEECTLVFPVHPRTRQKLDCAGLSHPRIRFAPPLGYLDFLRLVSAARVVLTDSGGVQEETTVLGVSCLTLRDNTERPVTLQQGSNRLAGTSAESILEAWRQYGHQPARPALELPPLWDGKAASRVVEVLARL